MLMDSFAAEVGWWVSWQRDSFMSCFCVGKIEVPMGASKFSLGTSGLSKVELLAYFGSIESKIWYRLSFWLKLGLLSWPVGKIIRTLCILRLSWISFARPVISDATYQDGSLICSLKIKVLSWLRVITILPY